MCGLMGQFRQKKNDRRQYDRMVSFPFTDCDGIIVQAERRIHPDRRVMDIAADKGVIEHIEF